MALLAGFLLLIACGGLIAHISACWLVAARRFWLRRPGADMPAPGITLLCPLIAAGPEGAEAQRRILGAVFAEAWPRKEIIFCAAGLAEADLSAVRAAREAHAAAASLLIHLPAASGADGAAGLAAALAKGFKAARYDRVAIAPLNAQLPADYLAQFISRERRRKTKAAALIDAPFWAAAPRGAKARLRAAFANSWRARRLCLADSLGCGMAESAFAAGGGQMAAAGQAALLSYDAVMRAGGIDAFIRRAQSRGAAAAAFELARASGGRVYLTARPLALPAAQMAGGAGEAAWAGQYRRFLPHLFWAELLLSPFLPFAGLAAVCGFGLLPLIVLPLFAAVWYGAELLCCALWGRGVSAADCAFWLARDALLPFLWLGAAVRRPARAETSPGGKKQPA